MIKNDNWKRSFEIITCNICVDATDGGGEEAEKCDCSKPYSSVEGGVGVCCYDERCINFATQTECIDCYPGTIHVYMCMYMCMCVYLFMCLCVCVCVFMFVCM